MRIWLKNGDESRVKAEVGLGGDFIPDGKVQKIDKALFKNGELELFIEGIKASKTIGDQIIKVYADLDGDGLLPLALIDSVKATVFNVEEIHPINSDFVADVNKKGRVLISTLYKDDKSYYTIANTTKANKPAQDDSTGDAKVIISAYIEPKYPGIEIYFEVNDPDDLSPYEGQVVAADPQDIKPNDNRDPNKTMNGGTIAKYRSYQNACLSTRSNKTELKNINGVERAVAEVTLNITKRYSGDNYKVRAVGNDPENEPFDTNSGLNDSTIITNNIKESALLVSWKRVYIEFDTMYKMGATVLSAFTSIPGSTADDVITVDNASDFAVGDNIEFFLSNGTTRTRVLKSKTATSLSVDHLDINLPLYSGVKLVTSNNVFSVTLNLFEQAYGENTNGADGGAFVEFVQLVTGSGNIPKYNEFQWSRSDRDRVAFEFCNYWFLNSVDRRNIIQLVSANKNSDGTYGTSDPGSSQNSVFVTIGNFAFTDNIAATNESAVHELGHQFNVKSTHVDSSVSARNIFDTDGCVMSYTRTRDNKIVEFDIVCLFNIRDAFDPR